MELVTALALLVLVVLLQVYHLDADPPTGLSASSGPETDPPQYTLFAKNFVQTGEFDPFDDARRSVFFKSSVTVLALGIFGLLGTGLWQSNFVGLLYGLGALVCLWLFMRRTVGQLAGLLFLLLVAVNYNLIFYGRLPFLEHAMTFWAFLSVVLIVYGGRSWVAVLAGISFGLAVFFSKAIGIVFAFPIVWLLVYRLFLEKEGPWMARWREVVLYVVGFAVVAVGWYFVTYGPAQSQVSGYYGEQAFSLYGAPAGLASFDDFFKKMLSFGDSSKLFERMEVVSIATVIFLAVVFYAATNVGKVREGLRRLGPGRVFLAATVIGFYGSLMIWNYRPLRYQLVLIYAVYGAAAALMASVWRSRADFSRTLPHYLWYVPAVVLFTIPVYKIWDALSEKYAWHFSYNSDKGWVIVVAVLVVGLVVLALRYWPENIRKEAYLVGKALVVIAILGTTITGVLDYADWANRPTFTARDNSKDLGMALNDGAVLSGPYAPLLALENEHEVVIHMFGVAEADPELFRRFPITHLLLDESNERLAKNDYPQIMDSAVLLWTYHVGLDKVRLYQIAGITGNPQAARYRPSLLERAVEGYYDDSTAAGHVFAAQYLEQHPTNLSGYQAVGEVAAAEGHFGLAEQSFRQAVSFSPTNYNLNSRLAQLYKDQYERTGDAELRRRGMEYFEEAIRLAPGVGKLKVAYRELKNDNIGVGLSP